MKTVRSAASAVWRTEWGVAVAKVLLNLRCIHPVESLAER